MYDIHKRLSYPAGLILLATITGQVNAAQFDCFDFTDLATDTEYTVGDTVETAHASIVIKPYFIQGEPTTATVRHAESVQTAIAGGMAPELSLYLVSVNVLPRQPVTEVRTRFAQSISQDGNFANANIEVNGEKHESIDGFADMDGREIGNPGKGRARIHTSMQPPSGNWHAGELMLRAKPGDTIQSFTLGAHTWRIDDMCLAL